MYVCMYVLMTILKPNNRKKPNKMGREKLVDG